MQEMGASQADIEAATLAKHVAEELELFEDNVRSVTVFDLMDTQWDRAGMDGTRVGLKFSRAPIFMRMAGVERADRDQVMEDLKVMELEALRVYAENAK